MNGNGGANGVATAIPVDESLRLSIATDANASVLQRMDSHFLHVLTSASHVSMYKLEAKNWERYDVEGSTFIYQRDVVPEYRIFCLNRRSTDNFCLDIVPGAADIELVNEKMIAFPGTNGDIFGMWFYVQEELRMFHDAFSAIVRGDHVPPLPRTHRANNNNNSNANHKKESPKKKARNPAEPKHQKNIPAQQQTTANHTAPAAPVPSPAPVPVQASGFSLQRFFPNLQPTANGVIGSSIPAKAHDVTVAESSAGPTQQERKAEPSMTNVSFGHYSASVPLNVPNVRSEPPPVEQPNLNSNPNGIGNAAFMNLFQGKPAMPTGSPLQNVMGSGPALVANPIGLGPMPNGTMSPSIVPGANRGVGRPAHSMPMMLPGAPPGMSIPSIPGIPGMHPAHFQALQVQQHMAYLAHQRAQVQHFPPQHVMPNMMPVMANGVSVSAPTPAGDAILGMLKPNSVASPKREEKTNSKSAGDIGAALGAMKLSESDERNMNKAEFRAVVQRMLSDKKLFDSAYATYISRENK